jgi:hypothetical protein
LGFREIEKISGRIYRLHLNTESSGSVGVAIGNRLTIVARDNDPVLKLPLKLALNLFVTEHMEKNPRPIIDKSARIRRSALPVDVANLRPPRFSQCHSVF